MRKPTWFFFGLIMAQCGSMVQKRLDAETRPAFANARLAHMRASR
jgi:hypothetical protein